MNITDSVDKRNAHLWVDRILTPEEWESIRNLPYHLRYTRGDCLPIGKLFKGYNRSYKNGIQTCTAESLADAIIKGREYAKNNPEPRRKWRKNNQEKHNLIIKNWHKANVERTRLKRKERYGVKSEEINKTAREWRKRNPEKVKKYRKTAYLKIKSDEGKWIGMRIRSRLRSAVKDSLFYRNCQDKDAVEFLRWSAKERGFDPLCQGYDIDHIIPVSKWDLSIAVNQKLVNSPENVRWMSRSDNLKKGTKSASETEIREHAEMVSKWRQEFNAI